MALHLTTNHYVYSKTSSDKELNIFKKEMHNVRIVLTYTISGRGTYSAFGRLKIIYLELTQILFDLFQDSDFAKDYNLENDDEISIGIGITSEVGRHSPDKNTYYCASIDEVDDFAINFSRQIILEEKNFVNPRLDVATTIKSFMRPMHAHWPGPLKVFLEHLVAYGVKNSDPSIIKYAFNKADEICQKINPIACQIEFIDTLKERVKKLEFMKGNNNPGEVS